MAQRSLRVLSFNVFPGSPVPIIGGGIGPMYPDRVQMQLDSIADLEPDVIALQELYCVMSLNLYRTRFSQDFHMVTFPGRHPAGMFILVLLETMVSLLLWLTLLGVLRLTVVDTIWPSCAVVTIAIIWFAVHVIGVKHFTLPQYLSGQQTGLALLVRKSLFSNLQPAQCTLFDHQEGDMLNILQPRGFICLDADVQVTDDTTVPCRIAVTHLDHGETQNCAASRKVQIGEVLGQLFSQSSEGLAILCADFNDHPESVAVKHAKTTGLQDAHEASTQTLLNDVFTDGYNDDCHDPSTHKLLNENGFSWDDANPLTRTNFAYSSDMFQAHVGEMSARIDYVFFKDMGSSSRVRFSCARSELVLTSPPLSDHYGVMATLRADCPEEHV